MVIVLHHLSKIINLFSFWLKMFFSLHSIFVDYADVYFHPFVIEMVVSFPMFINASFVLFH